MKFKYIYIFPSAYAIFFLIHYSIVFNYISSEIIPLIIHIILMYCSQIIHLPMMLLLHAIDITINTALISGYPYGYPFAWGIITSLFYSAIGLIFDVMRYFLGVHSRREINYVQRQ